MYKMYVCAIVGVIFYAISNTMLGRMGKIPTPLVVMFTSGVTFVFASAGYLIKMPSLPPEAQGTYTWMLFASFIGLAFFLGDFAYIEAFRREIKVSEITMIATTIPIIATAVDWALKQHWPGFQRLGIFLAARLLILAGVWLVVKFVK